MVKHIHDLLYMYEQNKTHENKLRELKLTETHLNIEYDYHM